MGRCLSPDPKKPREGASSLAAFSLSNQGAWFGKGPKIITQRGREQRQVIIPEKYRGFSK